MLLSECLYILKLFYFMHAELKRENRIDGTIAVIASLLVLFTAMIDPMASAILAISGLVVYSIYKFTRKK